MERQDDAAQISRRLRGRRGSARRDRPRAGTVAAGLRPGQALSDRHHAAALRRLGGRRQDGAGRHPARGGPHQPRGGRQRPADRAPDRRLRVQGRRRPPQGGEARPRGQGGRPPGRLHVERLPRVHAGLGGAHDRQHDRRLPRHDDHHDALQPVHLPPLRLRARPGRRLRALSRRQARQALAHRLSGLRVRPVRARRVRGADQARGRRGGGRHRHPARHRGHDGVPRPDQRQLRRPLLRLRRQGRRDDRQPGLRPRAPEEVPVGRRRLDRRVHEPAGARGQDRGLRRPEPLPAGVRGAAEHALPPEVLRRGRGGLEEDRSVGPAPRPLRPVELRVDELPEARHPEVGLPRPRGLGVA